MKFALSSLRAPDDFSHAIEHGYAGVEIAVDESAPAGVEVACVRLAAPLPAGRGRAEYARELGRAIDFTNSLGCRRLEIGGAGAAPRAPAAGDAQLIGRGGFRP